MVHPLIRFCLVIYFQSNLRLIADQCLTIAVQKHTNQYCHIFRIKSRQKSSFKNSNSVCHNMTELVCYNMVKYMAPHIGIDTTET